MVEGFDYFLKVFDFEFICEVLVDEHSTSVAVNACLSSTLQSPALRHLLQ